MSREALGDAAPDARDDLRAATDDAPTTVLATISLEPPDGAAPRGPADRPTGTRGTAGRYAAGAEAPDAPAGAPSTDHPADRPDDLDLDLTDAPADDAPDDAAPVAVRTPRRPRLVTAAVATAVLVVGVLAGVTSARQQGQAALDAAARVVVAVDSDGTMGYDPLYGDAVPGSGSGDVLQFLTISFTGRLGDATQVRVTELRSPIGTFALYPSVTLQNGGTPTRTLVRGAVDCTRINALRTTDTVTGHVLEKSVAVVRPLGSRRDVEVPVLVPNPDGTLFSLDQRCSPDRYQVAGDSYAVGALVAHADGSLEFVTGPGTAFRPGRPPGRLAVLAGDVMSGNGAELPPASRAGGSATFRTSDGRWTMTTTPALPLVSQDPVTVRVKFTYACPRSFRTDPLLPPAPELWLGTVAADGTVNPYLDGWDQAVLANATTAAVVLACKDVPVRAQPPARQGRTR